MSASEHHLARLSADTLRRCLPYAQGAMRTRTEKALQAYDHGKLSLSDVVTMAYDVARKTWSAREGVRKYCQTSSDTEWGMLIKMVRPSTAHLLKRLRASIGGSVNDVLSHTDADIALTTEEREEIDQIRTHIHEDLFTKHTEDLAPYIKSAEKEAKALDDALEELNGIGESMRGALQDQTLGRHRTYQEQWFLGDHAPTLETVKQEIQYAKDQLAINPFHE